MNGLKTIQADQMTEKWDFGQIGHQNDLREPVNPIPYGVRLPPIPYGGGAIMPPLSKMPPNAEWGPKTVHCIVLYCIFYRHQAK